MKIRPVGAELFHADGRTNERTDGQTDMMKQIVTFRNFAKAPKNYSSAFMLYFCVSYDSHNKQRLFPYTTLTDWSLQLGRIVFTARYGLNL